VIEPLSRRLSRVISWHEDVEGGRVDEEMLQLLRECLRVVKQYEDLLPVKA
jgi:hypothetical protein